MKKIVTVTTRGRYLSLFWPQWFQCTPWSQSTVFPIEPVVKVQRGCRGVAVFSLNSVARWVGWLRPRPGRFPLRADPTILIVEEAGWAPWPGWRGVEKRNSLVPTWVRTLNRSDCSESLYRLRCPGSSFLKIVPILVWVFLHAVIPSISDQDFVCIFFLPCYLIIFYTQRDRIFRCDLYCEMLCNVGAWILNIKIRIWRF